MTLMPSSGPIAWLAPGCASMFAAILFSGLVTAARREDQGREAYGRMRHARRPCESRHQSTTGVRVAGHRRTARLQPISRGVWAPAFAGATTDESAARLLRGLQHRDVIRHRRPAHVEDAGEFCVLDLQ